jgi:hypothetical protein
LTSCYGVEQKAELTGGKGNATQKHWHSQKHLQLKIRCDKPVSLSKWLEKIVSSLRNQDDSRSLSMAETYNLMDVPYFQKSASVTC